MHNINHDEQSITIKNSFEKSISYNIIVNYNDILCIKNIINLINKPDNKLNYWNILTNYINIIINLLLNIKILSDELLDIILNNFDNTREIIKKLDIINKIYNKINELNNNINTLEIIIKYKNKTEEKTQPMYIYRILPIPIAIETFIKLLTESLFHKNVL